MTLPNESARTFDFTWKVPETPPQRTAATCRPAFFKLPAHGLDAWHHRAFAETRTAHGGCIGLHRGEGHP